MYTGDLDTNRDIKKQGGDYVRTVDIDTAIRILLGTNKGYWGNALENNIPGGLEEYKGKPITIDFLANFEAQVERCLQPLVDLGLATNIIVSASNPRTDYIYYKVVITRTDKSEYTFTSED